MTPVALPVAPLDSSQGFTDLISAFLDDLDADERIDLMIAAQRFVGAFGPDMQDEALAMFWRSTPGFNAYEREVSRQEAA